jgi:hypothetical protein
LNKKSICILSCKNHATFEISYRKEKNGMISNT